MNSSPSGEMSMSDVKAISSDSTDTCNGAVNVGLEERLRHFFSEQHRLRDRLEQARTELDGVNLALLRFQDEYCTDPEREEEYDACIERITGCKRLDPSEIAEALANPQSTEEFLAELEQMCEERLGSANA
jgi:hypothetical protein